MCGLVTLLFVAMCVGLPLYLMWQLGEYGMAIVFGVVSVLSLLAANELGKPIGGMPK